MRLAILALTILTLSGAAYAQDENGGGGDNGAATTTAASSSQAPYPNDPFAIALAADEASCKLRGVDTVGLPCAGQAAHRVPSGALASVGHTR